MILSYFFYLRYIENMKFLQTGDLHLGKILHEQPLIEDQKNMLQQILQILETAEKTDKPYNGLLITGDIYDRAIPSPEAVILFDSFLTDLTKKIPHLHIFIISGNHDSAQRLSYAARLLEETHNIHITTSLNKLEKPVILTNKTPQLNESVAIYSIPFLQPSIFSEITEKTNNKRITQQQEMLDNIVKIIENYHKSNYPETPTILCGHLFTLGCEVSDSERISIGTAEEVNSKTFDFFTYTALGHLHRSQNIGKKIFYAGSPLAYSFSEANSQKSVLEINIDCTTNEFSTEKIPINPIHPVESISGFFEDFLYDTEKKYEKYKNSYLEINCKDKNLIENPMAQLKTIFPYLLAFKQDEAIIANGLSSLTDRRELIKKTEEQNIANQEIFTEFIKDTYGEFPENFEEEKELFLKLVKELEQEKANK